MAYSKSPQINLFEKYLINLIKIEKEVSKIKIKNNN
jgi:hypothetical protein